METLIIKGVSTRSFLRQLTIRDKQGPGGPRLYSGNFANTKVMRPGQTVSSLALLLCDADGCRIIVSYFPGPEPHKIWAKSFLWDANLYIFQYKTRPAPGRSAPVNWSGHNILTGKSLKKSLKFDRSRECGEVTLTATNQSTSPL